MSNRFHPKWHRKNHHTYGNDNNPDASHDPIASREQPFRGDFILKGSLSAVASLSAFAAFFYSSNTAISAIAGKRGAYIYSTGDLGIEVQSTARTAISAYGDYIGVEATSETIAISANAPSFGIIVSSASRAISAYGGLIGLEVGSRNIALSAAANNIGAVVFSRNIGLSALANSVGITTSSPNLALSAFGTNIGIATTSPNISLSAFGGNIGITTSSPNLALSAFGNNIGIATTSPNVSLSAFGNRLGASISSPNIALSAFGNNIGIATTSPNISLSAFGNNIGISTSSPNIALSAFGNNIASVLNSPNIALSAFGDNIAGVFLSNTVCLSTNGGITDAYPVKNNPYYGPNYISKNVLNNRTGIFTENPLSAFHVTGGSLFDGHMTITGNLSVAGDLTRFDTYVYITSSVEINVQNNSNTTPALYVINRGNNKIVAAYDGDVNNPGLIVDGDSSRPGHVGMGVLNPEVRLDIYNNATGTPQSAAAANGTVVHVSQADASPSRILVDSFGVASAARPSFTGRHSNGTAASPTAVQGNDVLCEFTGQGYGSSAYSTTSRGRMKINADEAWTNSAQGTYLSFETTQRGGIITSEVMKISSNGFVGINTTVPNERLTVAGSISAQNNLSAVYIHVAPGMNVNYPSYPNIRASFVSFIDGYAQVNAQNLNSGNAASTDIILTSDNGSDTANYIDLGINSSTYNQASFNISGAGDGYLYVRNNDLTIGTAGSADTTNDLIIHTGGTTTSQERMRITKTGVTTINNVTNANVSVNTASSGTGTTSIHNNTTNTAALAIGNTAAPATVGASTLGITTTGQVDLNSSTGRATNINTGSGAVTTTIGNNGTVAINGTTTIAGNTTIADTAGNTLTMGNQTGAVGLEASTLGIVTANTVSVNTTTGRAFDLNTGTNAATNINTGNTNSTATNIHTGGNTGALGLGNATGNTNIAGNAIGVTSAGTVSINTSTARTTNINTGSGAVTTTIGSGGTVAINGTTTIAGNTTIANTAGNTLTIGNSTGAVTAAASTYGLTTGDQVDINSSTARTTNINTGSGAVTTTIGNSTASSATVVNSPSVTAPNQTYVNGTSVITGSLGDTRYGQVVRNSTLGSVNNTVTLANTVGGIALEANSTYEVTAVASISVVGNTATIGSKVGFEGDGTLTFGYVAIDEMTFNSATATTPSNLTYSGAPGTSTFPTNTTSTTAATATTTHSRRRATIRTGTAGTLFLRHAVITAGGTNTATPATGSFIFARKIL